MRETRIDESGHITVKNLSAYWIPEIRVEREIHGTVYTVTGSFDGNKLLEKKLTRILLKNVDVNVNEKPVAFTAKLVYTIP